MACNGHNHPKNCQCNFRGGHRNTRPPASSGWTKRSAKQFRRPTTCPEGCGATVYFMPFKGGRGTFFDSPYPPMHKHPCTDHSLKYSPFNKHGTPKLRNRRSKLEKDGWTPFFIKRVEAVACGTLLHGEALENPTTFHFGIGESDIFQGTDNFIHFKVFRDNPSAVELHIYSLDTDHQMIRQFYNNCDTELELAARLRNG